MPIRLQLACSAADCKSTIDGEEEINLAPMPISVDLRARHGHLILEYAEGLVEDLSIAARAAGWQRDGGDWLCEKCLQSRKGADMNCPQCGKPTNEWSDGVCLVCSKENEEIIAEHHMRGVLWNLMTPRQRELAIKIAKMN